MEKHTHFGYQSIPEAEKTEKVAEVFTSVAPNYDLMNDVMSFGLHRYWKDYFVWQLEAKPNMSVLDLASGTGDIAKRLAKSMRAPIAGGDILGRLVMSDINPAMLEIGKANMLKNSWLQNIEYVIANAEELPFPEQQFDLLTMAFGLRNVTHQQKALAEMFRVLKPGGKAFILEFSQVNNDNFRKIYDFYSFKFLPWAGEKIAKDRASYQYLAESIRMHPNQETLKNMFLEAGFARCEYLNLSGGIVAIHQAQKL